MLGGLNPIIIFNFSKKLPSSVSERLARIPLIAKNVDYVNFPPIPIYLSENLTGLFIESEDKNVDIETYSDGKSDGSEPDVSQKPVASTVAVSMLGKKDSIGLALLSAMIDVLYEKVSSKEYSITYLHGATTIFRAKLAKYQATQNNSNDLLMINFELTKGQKTPSISASVPTVPRFQGITP